MIMVATTRTQNRYDHRLRELVQTTQDVSCAVSQTGKSIAIVYFMATELTFVGAGQVARQFNEPRG